MQFKILNKVTGHIFYLDESEAKRVLESNKDRFEAVNNDIDIPEDEPTKPTEKGLKNVLKGDYAAFEEMNVTQLREYCKDNEIDIKGCGNSKEKILSRIKGE